MASMVVDREARNELVEALLYFIDADFMVDDFDELCGENIQYTSDAAVVEIVAAVDGINGVSSIPIRFRLFDDQSQKFFEQAVLFLRTDKKYEWPRIDSSSEIFGYIVFCFLPFVVVLMLFTGIFVIEHDWEYAFGSAIPFVLSTGLTIAAFTVYSRRSRDQLFRFRGAGDIDAWPFLRQEDLAKAKELHSTVTTQAGREIDHNTNSV